MKVNLAGVEFKTKKALLDYTKKIKNSYSPGESVEEKDIPFLLDLIEYHPETNKIVGNGVEGFKVDYSPSGWGDICFWVKRLDGSEGFFSYHKCIESKSKISQIASVMRLSVKSQIDDFRQKTFFEKKSIPCPITGEIITYKSCHVDHAHPATFEILRNGFLLLHKSKKRFQSIDDIKLIGNPDGVGQVFADSDLMSDWVEYHRKYAKLRCVSVSANLIDLRRDKRWRPLNG